MTAGGHLYLQRIAAKAERAEQRGESYEHETTVRELLRQFNAKRRGKIVVARIRRSLERFGLHTDPDFERTSIDTTIRIVLRPKQLAFRPYARLLTMLGDQLIRSGRVALVELIKNAYDADAEHVEVRFENFDDKLKVRPDSVIAIEDDGVGMNLDTIEQQWMNPATPAKIRAKRAGEWRTPVKDRVLQGEKGIGRFAILKLGRSVKITTKVVEADREIVLACDFSGLDDELIHEDSAQGGLFLDEIRADCSETLPSHFPSGSSGTLVEVASLRSNWTKQLVNALCDDVLYLMDPISRVAGRQSIDDFEIVIRVNGTEQRVDEEEVETLKALIEDKPVLSISGGYRTTTNSFVYAVNSTEKEVPLDHPQITGLWLWRNRYGRRPSDAEIRRRYSCGDFDFQFYMFDFSHGVRGRHALTQKEKAVLKKHRIYLYRDGLRVYPYGNKDDDWIGIDVVRGTGRAAWTFSNDQVVGWIDITHEGNPKLRDKTSREGLLDDEGSSDEFIFLVHLFLSYIKRSDYATYEHRRIQRATSRAIEEGEVARQLTSLKDGLKKAGYGGASRKVSRITSAYQRERRSLTRRAEITEDLAGVGLSVEMASHDIMLLLNRTRGIAKNLAKDARRGDTERVEPQADMLVGVLDQIAEGMTDVQSLFKASRRRRKRLRVEALLDRIAQIYDSALSSSQIEYEKEIVGRSPLVASTTDGVVMQVLINLFDNAIYWLDSTSRQDKRIRVRLDSDSGELVFADNGPGIDEDDRPFIFDAFYSGKGQEGRGLGLYIARQLLDRHDYQIGLAERHQRLLPGATFVVTFAREEK